MKKYVTSRFLIFTVLMVLFAVSGLQAQEVFRKVDIMPEYPGGQTAMSQFITKNIQWPKDADAQVQGTVYVTFIVETNGTLTQVQALKGIGEAFEKEAERVVSKMPNWKPGKNQDKEVRVMLNLPIEFKLTK